MKVEAYILGALFSGHSGNLLDLPDMTVVTVPRIHTPVCAAEIESLPESIYIGSTDSPESFLAKYPDKNFVCISGELKKRLARYGCIDSLGYCRRAVITVRAGRVKVHSNVSKDDSRNLTEILAGIK